MDSPILSSAQMRAVEEAAFARGVEVESLMDAAGLGVANAVREYFPSPGRSVVFAGKGHNGGDALVAATHLARSGWDIDLRLAFPESDLGDLTQKKLRSLREAQEPSNRHPADNPESREQPADNSNSPENHAADNEADLGSAGSRGRLVVLDGLLGTGAKSFLREPIRSGAREINRLRREEGAFVFAVDLPTGLDGNTGEIDPEDSVIADFTVTIGFAKHGLIVDESIDLVRSMVVVPLADLIAEDLSANEIAATPQSFMPLLPRRKYSAYKNQFGRIGVVAGSKGLVGAAVMTASGALRAGAGLVELFVPEDIYEIVAAAAPIEAMVKPVRSYKTLLDEKVDVWAVGPGLGASRAGEILNLIERADQPMVVDADGLNALAGKIDILRRARGPRLLTPHPGEMNRLVEIGKMSRAGVARNFCEHFPVALLFKGSRTIVSERGKPLSYNTTGNPGMASGGMGDVLTGVCAGLLGRKLSTYDAGRIGAWVCGRAAEIAVFNFNASEESLLASDVLAHLGAAFNEIHHPKI